MHFFFKKKLDTIWFIVCKIVEIFNGYSIIFDDNLKNINSAKWFRHRR